MNQAAIPPDRRDCQGWIIWSASDRRTLNDAEPTVRPYASATNRACFLSASSPAPSAIRRKACSIQCSSSTLRAGTTAELSMSDRSSIWAALASACASSNALAILASRSNLSCAGVSSSDDSTITWAPVDSRISSACAPRHQLRPGLLPAKLFAALRASSHCQCAPPAPSRG